ncbi:MAG: hypothetical protein GEU94_04725 [Micromonosporaceae bacterium]|nr:hypothetical protein [Micromonosporaceae bacterium]
MLWYGVRTIVESSEPGTYEERITIWLADSFEHAIEQAEEDAIEYTEAVGGGYVGMAQAYLIGDGAPGNGDEVFSLMRDSDLPPQEYVTRFFDTGDERQGGAP